MHDTEEPGYGAQGVGEIQTKRFAVLGIKTVADLIDYYPRRYDDYSDVQVINKLKPGPVTIRAQIKQAKGRRARRGLHITEAVASDDSGSVRLVWFNQPYRAGAIKSGQEYFISGEYQLSYRRLTIMNPRVEMVSEFPLNTARILAIYRETPRLTFARLERLSTDPALDSRATGDLAVATGQGTQTAQSGRGAGRRHFPESPNQLEAARRRLGFEEAFQLSLASLMNKRENRSEHSLKITYKEQLAVAFSKSLPFKLTDDQRRTVMRVYRDLEKGEPMNRLVEGDVGSGKTVVAAMTALMAIAQGWPVAFMAPTELLARQHAETIHNLLGAQGYGDRGLLVGSMSAKQKQQARTAIASGRLKFIIGTQALIQEKVDMHKLALIIVDEQHRFGVEQRKTLMAKAGHMPHVLSLTATPIPRSLALTLYGELDVSVLAEKPAGRQPVTHQTGLAKPPCKQLYQDIDDQIEQGRPGVRGLSGNQRVGNNWMLVQLKRSTSNYRPVNSSSIAGSVFCTAAKISYQAGSHAAVYKSRPRIWCSTTVIEVGVDIPNASVMLIESPPVLWSGPTAPTARPGRPPHHHQASLLSGTQ